MHLVRRLPPLGTLRAFEAAARHLSFKEAATEFGLTPTAISHQIRLLEKYCGETLFRRRPRPLALSDRSEAIPGNSRRIRRIRIGSSVTRQRSGGKATPCNDNQQSVARDVHADVALSIIGVDRVVKLDDDEADVAIRYARSAPHGASHEIFRDQFYPVCKLKLLAKGPTIRRAGDFAGYPLIHFDWFANDPTSPNWKRWFEMASADDPRARQGCEIALSFREELHAIEAALAGQGIALCSDVIVADDLASGSLVKALDLAVPGYGFYPVYATSHPRRATIEVFVQWISTVDRRGTAHKRRPRTYLGSK
jgi:LysR family transcriptional regulator, glycine cleavage system transcriptional activator